MTALVRSLRDEHGLAVFLNADHTHTLEGAVAAARAGFDSVVFDLSALPFAENIRQTNAAVPVLKAINPDFVIEGEIGYIGSGSEIHNTAPDLTRGLTSPEQAREFVAATGVDVLAPAVGNMHGMLAGMVRGTAKIHLDLRRIAQIKQATGALLTLHGGSGTADADFAAAIAAGINIIHVSTELRLAWHDSLAASLQAHPEDVVPYKLLRPVTDAVQQVAAARLRLFNRLV